MDFNSDFTLFGSPSGSPTGSPIEGLISAFSPSSSSSGSGNPTPVPSIRAEEPDIKALRDLRVVLAARCTTYYRYEKSSNWAKLIDPDEARTQLLLKVCDIAKELLDRAKSDIDGHELVRLHDRVNPFNTLWDLASDDGKKVAKLIAEVEPEDREEKSRLHWRNLFDSYINEKLKNWDPYIADVEHKDVRWDRQQKQEKQFKRSEKDRRELRRTKLLDVWFKDRKKDEEFDENEVEALMRAERHRRRNEKAQRQERENAEARDKRPAEAIAATSEASATRTRSLSPASEHERAEARDKRPAVQSAASYTARKTRMRSPSPSSQRTRRSVGRSPLAPVNSRPAVPPRNPSQRRTDDPSPDRFSSMSISSESSSARPRSRSGRGRADSGP